MSFHYLNNPVGPNGLRKYASEKNFLDRLSKAEKANHDAVLRAAKEKHERTPLDLVQSKVASVTRGDSASRRQQERIAEHRHNELVAEAWRKRQERGQSEEEFRKELQGIRKEWNQLNEAIRVNDELKRVNAGLKSELK